MILGKSIVKTGYRQNRIFYPRSVAWISFDLSDRNLNSLNLFNNGMKIYFDRIAHVTTFGNIENLSPCIT